MSRKIEKKSRARLDASLANGAPAWVRWDCMSIDYRATQPLRVSVRSDAHSRIRLATCMSFIDQIVDITGPR